MKPAMPVFPIPTFPRKRGEEQTNRCASFTLNCPTTLVKSLVMSCAFCLLPSALCYAEELLDPTRPPEIIAIPATGIVGSAPSGLQSIIISKNRSAAIIDGEIVELRGKHGDATLIEVSETGVVLQGARGRQVLTLFPEVQVMQKESQVSPKLSEKEGELAQKAKLEARKERK
jgi:hypothetical protein